MDSNVAYWRFTGRIMATPPPFPALSRWSLDQEDFTAGWGSFSKLLQRRSPGSCCRRRTCIPT
eukprot:5349112-Prorocentrum_lima.AAC.1